MSRIGKLPVKVPNKVNVNVEKDKIGAGSFFWSLPSETLSRVKIFGGKFCIYFL